MLKEFILKITNRKLIREITSIEVTQRAIGDYRYQVKGKRNLTDEEIIKRIQRNFYLAKDNDNGRGYRQYGNMDIHYKGNLITYIINKHRKGIPYNINNKMKSKLNVLLGI